MSNALKRLDLAGFDEVADLVKFLSGRDWSPAETNINLKQTTGYFGKNSKGRYLLLSMKTKGEVPFEALESVVKNVTTGLTKKSLTVYSVKIAVGDNRVSFRFLLR